MRKKEPHEFVGVKLPWRLVGNRDDPDEHTNYTIAKFERDFHKRDRTEAITDLLELALQVVEKKDVIKDSALLGYLKENLYHEKIVDWFATLPDDRVEALYGALKDEKEIRLRNKFHKNH